MSVSTMKAEDMDSHFLRTIELDPFLNIDTSSRPNLLNQHIRFNFVVMNKTYKFKLNMTINDGGCHLSLYCTKGKGGPLPFKVELSMSRLRDELLGDELIEFTYICSFHSEQLVRAQPGEQWNHISALRVAFYHLTPKVPRAPRSHSGDPKLLYLEIESEPESFTGDRFVLQSNDDKMFYVYSEVMKPASRVLERWIEENYDGICDGQPYKVDVSSEALRELLHLVYSEFVTEAYTANLADIVYLADYLDMKEVLAACAQEIKHELLYGDQVQRMIDLLQLVCRYSLNADELCPMAMKSLTKKTANSEENQKVIAQLSECLKLQDSAKVTKWWVVVCSQLMIGGCTCRGEVRYDLTEIVNRVIYLLMLLHLSRLSSCLMKFSDLSSL